MIITIIIVNESKIIVINNNACIPILPTSPRGSRRAQKILEFFWWKSLEIRMLLHYKNKARGNIFEENGISDKFC